MKHGLMVVRSNPKDGLEAEFNDWYDNTHFPEILAVPGFVSAKRYKLTSGDANGHEYIAVYEYEHADDLTVPIKTMREQARTIRDVVDMTNPPNITQYERLGD
jgi:hypothetical protein